MTKRAEGRFDFDEPSSIADAKARKRRLENKIADISLQLANKVRRRMTSEQFQDWRRRTRNALMMKEAEQRFLKDWIVEQRRQLVAAKLDIEDATDSIDILIAVRTELQRGERARTGLVLDVIEQYLTHSA